MRLGLVILFSVSAVMVASDAAAYSKQIRKFAKQLMKVSKDRYPMLSSELAGDIEESFRDEIKFMKLAVPQTFEKSYHDALERITNLKIGVLYGDSGFEAGSMEPNAGLKKSDPLKTRIARVQRLNFALSLVRTRWHEHVDETATKNNNHGVSNDAEAALICQGPSSLVALVNLILGRMGQYTAADNLFEWTHDFDMKGVFGVGETLLLLESVAWCQYQELKPLINSIKLVIQTPGAHWHNWHALVVAVAQTPLSKLMQWKFPEDIKKIIDFTKKEIKDDAFLSQTGKDGLFNICS